MAIMEHNRWVNERITNGWAYGERKDVSHRISPYIAPWDDIPEEIKEYDRETVRNMIPIIEKSNLKVIKN